MEFLILLTAPCTKSEQLTTTLLMLPSDFKISFHVHLREVACISRQALISPTYVVDNLDAPRI